MNDLPRRETYLYELWERGAVTGAAFQAEGGERVVVIAAGERNVGAGPDYLDSVLLINGTLAVGAIEMHRSEEEWFAHGHQHDRAYDAVILHLVGRRDPVARLDLVTLEAASLEAASLEAASLEAASLEALAPSAAHVDPHADAYPAAIPDAAPEIITPELLAELAWGRLLRRVIEIVRHGAEPLTDRELRRAFVARLFDALGYAANRAPMGIIARGLLEREDELPSASFEDIAAVLFNMSGLDHRKILASGSSFMSESRLRNILKNHDLPRQIAEWRYDTRPGNAPERRLWGAAKLIYDIYRSDLLLRLHRLVEARAFASLAELLAVRIGSVTFVGNERAREIAINALLPVSLATGIVERRRGLIEGACALYREAPGGAGNRIVRRIEERFTAGFHLDGAFWQQGAIEFHQRFLLPDRSGLSFIAEPKPAPRPNRQGF